MTDYVLPDGTAVPITIGDYRQLSDALFHAGTDSGSEFEHVDAPNRLHFYVLDVHRSSEGVLSYTVAIRSLDGSGPQQRGARLTQTSALTSGDRWARCQFPLRNNGRDAGEHPEEVDRYLDSDVYRLSASASPGWSVSLPNELATARVGRFASATVYAKRESGRSLGRIALTATSESDPNETDRATCEVRAR